MRGSDSVIRQELGELSRVVRQAEAALISAGSQVYQRGGELVRPAHVDDVRDDEGVRRSAGSLILKQVNETWLTLELDRVADWRQLRLVKGKEKPVWTFSDPKPVYPRTLLSLGAWRFPVIRGTSATPTLALDGRVIETPGYDAASGLYLDFDPSAFSPVPDKPTREDARRALDLILHPLRAMPWATPDARSVALSAVLTSLVRASLRASPLHAFDSPTAGTGKSLICDYVGIIKTGASLPAMSQGKVDEEDEKRLSTVLYAGDPVILIDNCERPLQGDFLCSMLTQEVVQARILGLSERRVLPATSLIIASGNNISTRGDATRRTVICRIDSGLERPDERKFDFNVREEAKSERAALVVAGLTALRAYRVSGTAVSLPKAVGSFEDWDWIRGTLVWLGEADPAQSRETVITGDSQKNELAEVMDLWEEAYGSEPMGVEEARVEAPALEAKLVEAACPHGTWDSRRIGWWLRRNKDRVLGGRCFKSAPEPKHGHLRWHLAGAKPKVSDGRVPF